jgi:hypothetical protein
LKKTRPTGGTLISAALFSAASQLDAGRPFQAPALIPLKRAARALANTLPSADRRDMNAETPNGRDETPRNPKWNFPLFLWPSSTSDCTQMIPLKPGAEALAILFGRMRRLAKNAG